MNLFENFFDFNSDGRLDAIERSSLYDEIERIEAEVDAKLRAGRNSTASADVIDIDDLDDDDLDDDDLDDDDLDDDDFDTDDFENDFVSDDFDDDF